MMKPHIVAIALLLPIALLAANSKVEIGQTQKQTIEALGKPQGVINLNDKILLLYAEGEVTIRDGAVSKIDLMSDAQFAQDQERLKQERAEWVVQQEKLVADRIQAGEELKAYQIAEVAPSQRSPPKTALTTGAVFKSSSQKLTSLQKSPAHLERLRNRDR